MKTVCFIPLLCDVRVIGRKSNERLRRRCLHDWGPEHSPHRPAVTCSASGLVMGRVQWSCVGWACQCVRLPARFRTVP
jgi:hypothetical protein